MLLIGLCPFRGQDNLISWSNEINSVTRKCPVANNYLGNDENLSTIREVGSIQVLRQDFGLCHSQLPFLFIISAQLLERNWERNIFIHANTKMLKNLAFSNMKAVWKTFICRVAMHMFAWEGKENRRLENH